jgi:radical SAM protein with 4Fe4S-binding SPASM domain
MEYYCSTNAVSLTNEMSDFLVDNSKGRLHLSLYSTSEQSFELVHGIKGKGYNKVVANIEYLFNRLIKKKNPELLIFMNYLDTEKDEGGYQVWLDKWLPLIEKVPHLKSTEKPYITWMGQVDDTEKNKRNAGFIHYNKPCEKIVDRLTVDWDGRVTACCLSWDEKTLNLGNIKSESLLDIWQGKRLRDIRDQMLRHDLSKLPGCASCEYSLGYIENKSSYFKWLFNLNGKSQ